MYQKKLLFKAVFLLLSLVFIPFFYGKQAGADGSVKNVWTDLHTASQFGLYDELEYILEEGIIDVNAQDHNGNRALHIASGKGFLPLVKKLVEYGAEINVQDRYGNSPLHDSIFNRHHDISLYLIQQGADIEAKDRNGYSLVYIASRVGDDYALEMLIQIKREMIQREKPSFDESAIAGELKAFVDARDIHNNTPLHTVSGLGLYRIAEILIGNFADIHAKDSLGFTPLHLASYMGDIPMVNLFLEHKALINTKNFNGDTPLHTVSALGYGDMLVYLLENKADIRALNNNGDTPLHWASWQGNPKTVIQLIESGVDVKVLNKAYKTAWDIAYQRDHTELLSLLEVPSQ